MNETVTHSTGVIGRGETEVDSDPVHCDGIYLLPALYSHPQLVDSHLVCVAVTHLACNTNHITYCVLVRPVQY